MEPNTITLLTPDRNHKITAMIHMKEYYLKKGYFPYKENFLKEKYLQKFIFQFLRKLKILFKLIFYYDIVLHDPKKRDFVVYDCERTKEIEKVLPNDNYTILSTRAENIKILYFSKKIFLFIILNFFKRSLKQNYLAALVKIISPKVVVTHIDNSRDFFITADIFKNKIKFIAIQQADRDEVRSNSIEINKKVFIPEFLCFSGYDKKLYEKKKCNIGKFEIIGSLTASLSKEYIKSAKIKINPERYDICLISEPHPVLSGSYSHIKNYAEAIGKIAEYTHRLCKRKKLSLIFAGKRNEELDACFYKKYLQDYDFKIFHAPKSSYPTYQNILQSKLVIGHISTTLREAFCFDKKVLQCNFTEHPDVEFPANGLCVLNNVSYDLFEERVIQILSMTEKEYFNRLGVQRDFIMKSTIDTANVVRNKLKGFLQ